jgi:integrase
MHGQKYSHNSYGTLTKPINEYMRFLREYEYVGENDVFSLNAKITLEQKKRGDFKQKRSSDTYSIDDLKDIKNKIDATYANDPKKKLRAYALYFGVCTGLRRGNLMGMKVENLSPEDTVPNFKVTDNIVSGWSRGKRGVIVFENSTKTTSSEVGEIRLPMLQPSPEILIEVTSFLKQHLNAHDRLITAHPDSAREYWLRISEECNFKFLSPLQWRHSYATIGAAMLSAQFCQDD